MIESVSPNTPQPSARPATSAARQGIDPRTLMRIKSLDLRAKVVVQGFLQGLHRSPYHGFSVEFTEYRQYTPGDDPRYLDWRLFARSDRYYVKRFEDETNLRCHLLVDASKSMGFGSLDYNKSQYAATLGATLAYFLSLQRDAVGTITFDETIRAVVPARYRPGQLNRVFAALEKHPEGSGTDLSAPLEKIGSLVTKRGLLVLISDLLADLASLKRDLAALRAYGHDVMILQPLDPAEIYFSFDDSARFFDLETESQHYIVPSAVRDDYLRRFSQHQQTVLRVTEQLGIDYRVLPTDQPMDTALHDLLKARYRSGQGATRARGAGRGRRV